MAVDLVLLLCVALFAGAALYVSSVERPARLAGGTALALTEFRPSHRRGAVTQASLAALAGIGDWARGHGSLPLLAGLLTAFAIAFPLVVILPTNKRLMDQTLEAGGAEGAALLTRWRRLHAVRTVAGLAALLSVALHRAWAS